MAEFFDNLSWKLRPARISNAKYTIENCVKYVDLPDPEVLKFEIIK